MIMTVQKEQKTKQKEMLGKKQHFANILETPPKISQIMFSGELMSH